MTPKQRELYQRTFGRMDAEEIEELLHEWHDEGGCEATCEHGCWVEPDGACEHGAESWLRALGWI